MSESTVELNLKDPVLDHMGEPVREPTRISLPSSELAKMTNQEVYSKSPILKTGELILRLLSNIKPKDNADSGDIYVYIVKLRNQYKSDKAVLKLDTKDLTTLKEYVQRASDVFNFPMLSGYLTQRIREMEATLHKPSS